MTSSVKNLIHLFLLLLTISLFSITTDAYISKTGSANSIVNGDLDVGTINDNSGRKANLNVSGGMTTGGTVTMVDRYTQSAGILSWSSDKESLNLSAKLPTDGATIATVNAFVLQFDTLNLLSALKAAGASNVVDGNAAAYLATLKDLKRSRPTVDLTLVEVNAGILTANSQVAFDAVITGSSDTATILSRLQDASLALNGVSASSIAFYVTALSQKRKVLGRSLSSTELQQTINEANTLISIDTTRAGASAAMLTLLVNPLSRLVNVLGPNSVSYLSSILAKRVSLNRALTVVELQIVIDVVNINGNQALQDINANIWTNYASFLAKLQVTASGITNVLPANIRQYAFELRTLLSTRQTTSLNQVEIQSCITRGNAIADINMSMGGVLSITIGNPGQNYASNPILSFTRGGGTSATGSAAVANGKISTVTLSTAGSYYIYPPTVLLAGGGGGTGGVIQCVVWNAKSILSYLQAANAKLLRVDPTVADVYMDALRAKRLNVDWVNSAMLQWIIDDVNDGFNTPEVLDVNLGIINGVATNTYTALSNPNLGLTSVLVSAKAQAYQTQLSTKRTALARNMVIEEITAVIYRANLPAEIAAIDDMVLQGADSDVIRVLQVVATGLTSVFGTNEEFYCVYLRQQRYLLRRPLTTAEIQLQINLANGVADADGTITGAKTSNTDQAVFQKLSALNIQNLDATIWTQYNSNLVIARNTKGTWLYQHEIQSIVTYINGGTLGQDVNNQIRNGDSSALVTALKNAHDPTFQDAYGRQYLIALIYQVNDSRGSLTITPQGGLTGAVVAATGEVQNLITAASNGDAVGFATSFKKISVHGITGQDDSLTVTHLTLVAMNQAIKGTDSLTKQEIQRIVLFKTSTIPKTNTAALTNNFNDFRNYLTVQNNGIVSQNDRYMNLYLAEAASQITLANGGFRNYRELQSIVTSVNAAGSVAAAVGAANPSFVLSALTTQGIQNLNSNLGNQYLSQIAIQQIAKGGILTKATVQQAIDSANAANSILLAVLQSTVNTANVQTLLKTAALGLTNVRDSLTTVYPSLLTTCATLVNSCLSSSSVCAASSTCRCAGNYCSVFDAGRIQSLVDTMNALADITASVAANKVDPTMVALTSTSSGIGNVQPLLKASYQTNLASALNTYQQANGANAIMTRIMVQNIIDTVNGGVLLQNFNNALAGTSDSVIYTQLGLISVQNLNQNYQSSYAASLKSALSTKGSALTLVDAQIIVNQVNALAVLNAGFGNGSSADVILTLLTDSALQVAGVALGRKDVYYKNLNSKYTSKNKVALTISEVQSIVYSSNSTPARLQLQGQGTLDGSASVSVSAVGAAGAASLNIISADDTGNAATLTLQSGVTSPSTAVFSLSKSFNNGQLVIQASTINMSGSSINMQVDGGVQLTSTAPDAVMSIMASSTTGTAKLILWTGSGTSAQAGTTSSKAAQFSLGSGATPALILDAPGDVVTLSKNFVVTDSNGNTMFSVDNSNGNVYAKGSLTSGTGLTVGGPSSSGYKRFQLQSLDSTAEIALISGTSSTSSGSAIKFSTPDGKAASILWAGSSSSPSGLQTTSDSNIFFKVGTGKSFSVINQDPTVLLNISPTGDATIIGSTQITGAVTLKAGLTVGGSTSIGNTLAVTSDVTMNGKLTVAGAITGTDSLTIARSLTVGGTSATGPLSISMQSSNDASTMFIKAATNKVASVALISGGQQATIALTQSEVSIQSPGTALFKAGSRVYYQTNTGVTLFDVNGSTAASSINGALTVGTSLSVGTTASIASDTTIGGVLTVKGTSTLQGSVSISNKLSVALDASVFGDLAVGDSTVTDARSISVTSSEASATFSIQADTNNSKGGSATARLVFTNGNSGTGTIRLTGASTATTFGVTSSGTVDFVTGTSGQLRFLTGGSSPVQRFAVDGATGNVNIAGTLTVAQLTTSNGGLTCSDVALFKNTLTVNNVVTAANDITAGGAGVVEGSLIVKGDMSVGGSTGAHSLLVESPNNNGIITVKTDNTNAGFTAGLALKTASATSTMTLASGSTTPLMTITSPGEFRIQTPGNMLRIQGQASTTAADAMTVDTSTGDMTINGNMQVGDVSIAGVRTLALKSSDADVNLSLTSKATSGKTVKINFNTGASGSVNSGSISQGSDGTFLIDPPTGTVVGNQLPGGLTISRVHIRDITGDATLGSENYITASLVSSTTSQTLTLPQCTGAQIGHVYTIVRTGQSNVVVKRSASTDTFDGSSGSDASLFSAATAGYEIIAANSVGARVMTFGCMATNAYTTINPAVISGDMLAPASTPTVNTVAVYTSNKRQLSITSVTIDPSTNNMVLPGSLTVKGDTTIGAATGARKLTVSSTDADSSVKVVAASTKTASLALTSGSATASVSLVTGGSTAVNDILLISSPKGASVQSTAGTSTLAIVSAATAASTLQFADSQTSASNGYLLTSTPGSGSSSTVLSLTPTGSGTNIAASFTVSAKGAEASSIAVSTTVSSSTVTGSLGYSASGDLTLLSSNTGGKIALKQGTSERFTVNADGSLQLTFKQGTSGVVISSSNTGSGNNGVLILRGGGSGVTTKDVTFTVDSANGVLSVASPSVIIQPAGTSANDATLILRAKTGSSTKDVILSSSQTTGEFTVTVDASVITGTSASKNAVLILRAKDANSAAQDTQFLSNFNNGGALEVTTKSMLVIGSGTAGSAIDSVLTIRGVTSSGANNDVSLTSSGTTANTLTIGAKTLTVTATGATQDSTLQLIATDSNGNGSQTASIVVKSSDGGVTITSPATATLSGTSVTLTPIAANSAAVLTLAAKPSSGTSVVTFTAATDTSLTINSSNFIVAPPASTANGVLTLRGGADKDITFTQLNDGSQFTISNPVTNSINVFKASTNRIEAAAADKSAIMTLRALTSSSANVDATFTADNTGKLTIAAASYVLGTKSSSKLDGVLTLRAKGASSNLDVLLTTSSDNGALIITAPSTIIQPSATTGNAVLTLRSKSSGTAVDLTISMDSGTGGVTMASKSLTITATGSGQNTASLKLSAANGSKISSLTGGTDGTLTASLANGVIRMETTVANTPAVLTLRAKNSGGTAQDAVFTTDVNGKLTVAAASVAVVPVTSSQAGTFVIRALDGNGNAKDSTFTVSASDGSLTVANAGSTTVSTDAGFVIGTVSDNTDCVLTLSAKKSSAAVNAVLTVSNASGDLGISSKSITLTTNQATSDFSLNLNAQSSSSSKQSQIIARQNGDLDLVPLSGSALKMTTTQLTVSPAADNTDAILTLNAKKSGAAVPVNLRVYNADGVFEIGAATAVITAQTTGTSQLTIRGQNSGTAKDGIISVDSSGVMTIQSPGAMNIKGDSLMFGTLTAQSANLVFTLRAKGSASANVDTVFTVDNTAGGLTVANTGGIIASTDQSTGTAKFTLRAKSSSSQNMDVVFTADNSQAGALTIGAGSVSISTTAVSTAATLSLIAKASDGSAKTSTIVANTSNQLVYTATSHIFSSNANANGILVLRAQNSGNKDVTMTTSSSDGSYTIQTAGGLILTRPAGTAANAMLTLRAIKSDNSNLDSIITADSAGKLTVQSPGTLSLQSATNVISAISAGSSLVLTLRAITSGGNQDTTLTANTDGSLTIGANSFSIAASSTSDTQLQIVSKSGSTTFAATLTTAQSDGTLTIASSNAIITPTTSGAAKLTLRGLSGSTNFDTSFISGSSGSTGLTITNTVSILLATPNLFLKPASGNPTLTLAGSGASSTLVSDASTGAVTLTTQSFKIASIGTGNDAILALGTTTMTTSASDSSLTIAATGGVTIKAGSLSITATATTTPAKLTLTAKDSSNAAKSTSIQTTSTGDIQITGPSGSAANMILVAGAASQDSVLTLRALDSSSGAVDATLMSSNSNGLFSISSKGVAIASTSDVVQLTLKPNSQTSPTADIMQIKNSDASKTLFKVSIDGSVSATNIESFVRKAFSGSLSSAQTLSNPISADVILTWAYLDVVTSATDTSGGCTITVSQGSNGNIFNAIAVSSTASVKVYRTTDSTVASTLYTPFVFSSSASLSVATGGTCAGATFVVGYYYVTRIST